MKNVRGMGTIYRQKGSRFLWIQYYVDGKKYCESSKSEKDKDALALLKQRHGEAAHGEISPDSGTVGDFYQTLELDYSINKRKSVDDLKTRWKLHLEPFFSTIQAGKLDPRKIQTYIAQRQNQGAKNASINRELAALRRMFNLAAEQGRIKSVPKVKGVFERDNVREGFLSDEHYEALARETAKVGLWLRTMFEMGFTYGWRRSELTELKLERIDLAKRTIRLTPQMTKGKSHREIRMTPKVYELLKQCALGKGPNDYLFTREKDARGRQPKKGGHIADFRESWFAACQAAGIPGRLLFHDLRRTAASNLIDLGIDEKTAMTITGHKTRAVFDRYHIVRDKALKEATSRIEEGMAERQKLAQQVMQFPEETAPLAIEPPKKDAPSDHYSYSGSPESDRPN